MHTCGRYVREVLANVVELCTVVNDAAQKCPLKTLDETDERFVRQVRCFMRETSRRGTKI